jgi:hypothetical protein
VSERAAYAWFLNAGGVKPRASKPRTDGPRLSVAMKKYPLAAK